MLQELNHSGVRSCSVMTTDERCHLIAGTASRKILIRTSRLKHQMASPSLVVKLRCHGRIAHWMWCHAAAKTPSERACGTVHVSVAPSWLRDKERGRAVVGTTIRRLEPALHYIILAPLLRVI